MSQQQYTIESRLDTLPNELLHHVHSFLTESPESLKNLALVSQSIRAVSVRFIFGTLKLLILDDAQLRVLLASVPQIVRQHTRHLIVELWEGREQDSAEISELMYNKDHRFPIHVYDWFHCSMSREWTASAPELVYKPENSLLDWEPLSTFMANLWLFDFTWRCNDLLPLFVHKVVAQYQSNCRIHVDSICIPNFRGTARLSQTSLKISSLRTGYFGLSKDEADQITNAIEEGLEDLVLFINVPQHSQLGFESDLVNLQQLTLCGSLKHPQWLWYPDLNFSKLRWLSLSIPFGPSTLANMTACQFPVLHTLVLEQVLRVRPAWDAMQDDADRDTRLHIGQAMCTFLEILPPLEAIKLTGALVESSFRAIIKRHGTTLKHLHLNPEESHRQFTMSLEHIQAIAHSCKIIEELTIKLRRSRGDAREVACYRALGRLPKLRKLNILLDTSNYTLGSVFYTTNVLHSRATAYLPNEARFDVSDRRVLPGIRLFNRGGIRRGFVRDTLIDIAVDKRLAGSIFDTISAAKLPNSRPLERMDICVVNAFSYSPFTGHDSGLGPFRLLADRIIRPWRVERSERDDCQGELLIKEIGPKRRHDPMFPYRFAVMDLAADTEEIFQSIWPTQATSVGNKSLESSFKLDEKPWYNYWHSLPLELRSKVRDLSSYIPPA